MKTNDRDWYIEALGNCLVIAGNSLVMDGLSAKRRIEESVLAFLKSNPRLSEIERYRIFSDVHNIFYGGLL